MNRKFLRPLALALALLLGLAACSRGEDTQAVSEQRTEAVKSETVVPTAPVPPEVEPETLVVYGDSIPAGVGLNEAWMFSGGEWQQAVAGGGAGGIGCSYPDRAWPVLAAEAVGRPLESLACNGALLKSSKALAVDIVNLDGSVQPIVKSDVAAVQVGINNLDFVGLMVGCYQGADCQNTQVSHESRMAKFGKLYTKLLEELDQAHGVVLALTYPDPFDEGLNCGEYDFTVKFGEKDVRVTLAPEEVRYLRGLLVGLNDAIRDAVAQAAKDGKGKVGLVDIEKLYEGHTFCSGDPWVFGPSIRGKVLSSSAPFHPTAEGHDAIAKAVAEAPSTQKG